MKRILVLIAVFAIIGNIPARAYELFRDGKSSYSIVVARNASESEKFAAEELKYWLHEVSGVTIPVVATESGRRGHRIIVGYNPITAMLLPDSKAPAFGDESYRYMNKGGDILIWGGGKRGSLYGVYAFLGNEFGCRWYSSKVSVAPRHSEYKFKALDVKESPAIRMRNVFYKDSFDPAWAARNRSNGTMGGNSSLKYGGSESFWGSHTFNYFIDPKAFFGTHPEYFSEIDGKRLGEGSQLCLSNPDVLGIVIDGMRMIMRKEPSHLIYSLGQNDWGNPCQCERCKAIREQYGNTESGILIWFVNQVADAVRDEFPGKFVGTFAYMYTRTPPENIVPRDNVVVRLCSIEECGLHGMTDPDCEANASFRRDLEGWSKIAPHLFIWDYVATFTQYLAPMPNIWTFQDRIQCFRDNHTIGIMPQGNYQSIGTSFDELKAFVLSRLMWDPDCDVNAVIDDFLNGYFGAAGPVIREYMEYEREAIAKPGVHEGCFPLVEDNKIYSLEFAENGRAIFKKAYEAVAGQKDYVERVERAELALCYLQMLFSPRRGYDDGAWELLCRVCERDHITHLCEWGWYNSFESFRRDMSLCRYMDEDGRDAGDIKFEGTPIWLHFKKSSVESAAPGSVEEEFVGSRMLSFPFKGWNGKAELYLYAHDFAGGNENGSYHIGGIIEPGKEYTAFCEGNWRTEAVTTRGFDENYEYMFVVSDIDAEHMTFKIVQYRPIEN